MKRTHALFAFVALTVLLTAGAAQSLAGTNTVDSGDIVDRTIKARDIKVGGIAGQTILDNSMTGTDVNEATLVLACPAVAPTKVGDVCFGPVRPQGNWNAAASDCVSKKLRLPSQTEGMLVQTASYAGGEIWTDGRFVDNNTYFAMRAYPTYTATTLDSQPLLYRCATSVGARP